MRVRVKLHGTLRKFLPTGTTDFAILDLSNGATVADVITRLGIPPSHSRIVVVGEQQLEPTSGVHDGQELNLFPPLVGGV
jgi:molybdopterin converting factor small subunit